MIASVSRSSRRPRGSHLLLVEIPTVDFSHTPDSPRITDAVEYFTNRCANEHPASSGDFAHDVLLNTMRRPGKRAAIRQSLHPISLIDQERGSRVSAKRLNASMCRRCACLIALRPRRPPTLPKMPLKVKISSEISFVRPSVIR
jgi:hypothetical protein